MNRRRKREAQDVVHMDVAQQHGHFALSTPKGAAHQLVAQGAKAASDVEHDEVAGLAFDGDTGSVAAIAQGVGAWAGNRTPHSPEPNPHFFDLPVNVSPSRAALNMRLCSAALAR